MASHPKVTIDGQPVAIGVSIAYAKLKAAFEKAFPGLTLVITYGIRTYAQQEKLFRERYVTAGNVNGRHVYDTMSWKGVKWYRISSAGRVAPPGQSNHEEDGPSGGAAIDIRDTGKDAGVTQYGNKRSKWIKKYAKKYGFATTGYNSFNEPWHIELIKNPWVGSSTAATDSKPFKPQPQPEPVIEIPEEEIVDKCIIIKNTQGTEEWSLIGASVPDGYRSTKVKSTADAWAVLYGAPVEIATNAAYVTARRESIALNQSWVAQQKFINAA